MNTIIEAPTTEPKPAVADKATPQPTTEQLAAADRELAANPALAQSLAAAGIDRATFAIHGRNALAARADQRDDAATTPREVAADKSAKARERFNRRR